MLLWLVRYAHPDEDGWQRHLMAHVGWLRDQVAAGVVLASGPFVDRGVKAAMLIVAAPDRAAFDAIIASDPFAEHELMEKLEVETWDPVFGVFNRDSSMPAAS